MSNLKIAKEWIRKALAIQTQMRGSGTEKARNYEGLLKDPMSHKNWGLVRKSGVGLEGPEA